MVRIILSSSFHWYYIIVYGSRMYVSLIKHNSRLNITKVVLNLKAVFSQNDEKQDTVFWTYGNTII